MSTSTGRGQDGVVGSLRLRLGHLPAWAKRLVSVGALPEDTEEERLQKASLILTATMVTVLAIIWVVTYASLGLQLSAVIPLGYQVITVATLVGAARTGRYEIFRIGQLGLMLFLPALLQWSLGGFVTSSGVILWALVAPLGALVFSRRPLPWFLGYLSLTGISGLIEPLLSPSPIPMWLIVTFFVLNIGGVSTVVYFLLRYFMRGLAAEREKSEGLLLNMLPVSIARRLKAGERPLADRFDEAAVLFADLVGFTPISERLTPEEVVAMLDALFSEFDEMAETRQLEKIKTVGDAYMVVGGLPESRRNAAEAIAEMALDMQDLVAAYRTSSGNPLSLRIGIDIGPVVAGVIGRKKFTYDLWGDTVNTASRMESQGVPGMIQVTPRAHQRLKHRFRFEPRDSLEVKGKGLMTPFLLVGRAAAADGVNRA
jgi:adenylate cyclase